jgi:phage terminase Nu1 subunit (DNA packaging protein)
MSTDVTAEVLGRWLGISAVAVRQLAARGIVVKTKRGRYALEESVRRVCAHYRDIASDKGGAASLADIRAQRIRLARAAADGQEIKNATARGELVPAAEVEAEWSGVLRTVRAGMLAVPSRAAQRLPHLSAHDVGVIDGEVREVLTELGGAG